MKKCENCNIDIVGKSPVCPICGAHVGGIEDSPFEYPAYRVKNKVVKRIFIMLTVAAIVIGLFVNAFTYRKASYPWIAVLAAGLFIAWLMIGSWFSKRMSPGAKIYNTFSAAVFTCILIDISMGWDGWSTEYVIPYVTIADIATMTVLLLCGKKCYRRFFSYYLISLLMSLISPVLWLLDLESELWLALSPLLAAFIALLLIFTVSPSRMKAELRKRFHL